MNDFKCKRLGPSHSELLMAREDTFVDGTDEVGFAVVDATLYYSYEELVAAAGLGLFNDFQGVSIRPGVLNAILRDLHYYRSRAYKIEEILGS